MVPPLWIAMLIIALALFFGFTNGFHDSANQVATVISSRSLPPVPAMALASASDFAGAYFLGTKVAKTIGTGIIDPQVLRSNHLGIYVLFSSLMGAIVWNLATWRAGLPSSSSHALIGGLLGPFVAVWGFQSVQWNNVAKIVLVMLISPLIGFPLSLIFTKITFFFSQWFSPKANFFFKNVQVFSLIGQSLAHGANDAQKTMGVMVLALISMNLHPGLAAGGNILMPHWIIFSSSLSMALGIAFGGKRIIKRIGMDLYRVSPLHSFTSQSSSAIVMHLATFAGMPVSTTQVISSSVMGAGAGTRPKSVRWEFAGDMMAAWVITIPASGLIAAVIFQMIKRILF